MPRYYRRRYTRVVRPKKKWASCIRVWSGEPVESPYLFVLAANSAQSGVLGATSPTPTVVKVGNFKVTADMTVSLNTSSTSVNPSFVLYIMFVPEGISDSTMRELVNNHPEYIMATKVVGSSFQTGSLIATENVNVSTRMKRNLNSGDRIVLYIELPGSLATLVTSINLTGNVRYWCCNN